MMKLLVTNVRSKNLNGKISPGSKSHKAFRKKSKISRRITFWSRLKTKVTSTCKQMISQCRCSRISWIKFVIYMTRMIRTKKYLETSKTQSITSKFLFNSSTDSTCLTNWVKFSIFCKRITRDSARLKSKNRSRSILRKFQSRLFNF